MDRRNFLSIAFTAGVGLGLAARPGIGKTSESRKVIVIGAGLSGLVAAYELSKLNFDVTVIEAQERPGGRVLTLRSFSEGLWADAGAARIPDDHDLTLRYVKEFSLPLIPFYPTQDRFVRLNDGRPEAVGWDKFRDASGMVMFLEEPGKWRKIEGGNDRLPHAIAKRLEHAIIYNSPVQKISRAGSKLEVKINARGSLSSITADYLVCAIPATMLARIDTSEAFTESRISAIRSVSYDSASRVFIETKRRFWQDDKLNGFAFGSDYAEIWNSTFGERGTHGILQSYTRGNVSLALTRLTEAERISTIVHRLGVLFPQLKQNVFQGRSKCWSEDPWTLGAWAHPPEQIKSLIRSPEDRIFFAGEHLSSVPSWMQGAIESGLRVVKEITSSMPAGVQSSAI
jgi:monoamine oxidase